MTGFASVGLEGDGAAVRVTVKSVNHRFLDVALRLPSALGAIEGRLRALVPRQLARGRVEISLSVETTAAPEREVVLDEELLGRIAEALAGARARGVVTGELTVSDLLRLPQVLEVRTRADGAADDGVPAPLGALAERAVADALTALVAMRETEGQFIATDLDTRIATVERLVTDLERAGGEGQRQLEQRLRDRLAALPADVQADGAAVAQEVVRFVSRSDIDEEVVRLRGHLEHWRALAIGPEPCGRKLDFLVQEMNREINTIGSKIEGAGGTEVVITAKAELERIREQAQNVE